VRLLRQIHLPNYRYDTPDIVRTPSGLSSRLRRHKSVESRMSDDERAIRDLVATWMAASRAGDADTVLGLMADDVVFMVPGREPFGKTAFAANAQAMKGFRFDGTSDIRELKVLGDWAYLRNYLTATLTPLGGEPVRLAGYTLSILRKDPSGKWLLARDANLVAKAEA
jgi:uncharacterized protein (TIGR02246 family)